MATYPFTFIHCPYCDSKVQARVLGEREYPPGEESEPRKYQFVDCTQCGTSMVGFCEWEHDEEGGQGWGPLSRRWPQVEQQLHANIPKIVRRSLEEAKKCHGVKAYTACAVMVGRAIEGMCKDKVKSKYLAEGLKKLKSEGIIDDKLFKWGEALRNERNIGAHASVESISLQDASDVLTFAHAMAEYVYVLDEQYKDYVQRKSKAT